MALTWEDARRGTVRPLKVHELVTCTDSPLHIVYNLVQELRHAPRSRKRTIRVVTGNATCGLQRYTFRFNPNAVTIGPNWLGGFVLWGDKNPPELRDQLLGKRPTSAKQKTVQLTQILRGGAYHLDIGLSWRTAAVKLDRIERI